MPNPLLLICLLILPWLAAAQSAPPPKGHRLHRVRRLRPAPLPPSGLVAYDGKYQWGLADTLGRVYVRPAFEQEPEATAGPFWKSEWWKLTANEARGSRWQTLHGELEVWLNARGEYLVVPADYAAYRQADGSLVARPYRRHLTEPLYRFAIELDSAGRPSPRRYWRNWRTGWVYYLGAGLYAVRGPSARRYARQLRRHPQHVALGPPQAVFDSTGRRLTPYRYDRLRPLSDGRISFQREEQRTYGFLDRLGREVLGPYAHAGRFGQQRAVVMSAGPSLHRYCYALIDTSGAYVLAPEPDVLSGPDQAGFIRRKTELGGDSALWQYLRPDGQPAFAGRRFRWAAGFVADSAATLDTLGCWGTLRLDGSWQPRPQVPAKPKPLPAAAYVAAADSGRFRLRSAAEQPVTPATYAWAEALTGGWFATRRAANGPVVLISPAGRAYPLPAGYEPDRRYYAYGGWNPPPFAHGLLKVRWGQPDQAGGEPRREAYMTRGGRILTSDLSPE